MSKCPKVTCNHNRNFKCINNKNYFKDCSDISRNTISYTSSILESEDTICEEQYSYEEESSFEDNIQDECCGCSEDE